MGVLTRQFINLSRAIKFGSKKYEREVMNWVVSLKNAEKKMRKHKHRKLLAKTRHQRRKGK